MRVQSAVIILAWVVGTHAIFEEQAGLIDWHAEQLGRIEHAHFAFRGRDRLFVGSKAGVVASLDTKDGSIVWRQVLEGGTEVDDLVLIPRPASAVSLSHNYSVLRAWQALDGALLWERLVSDERSGQHGGLLLLPDAAGDTSSKLAVHSGHRLEVISVSNGKRVWLREDIGGDIWAVQWDARSQENAVVVAIAAEGTSYTVRLDARTGEEMSQASFPSPARIAALSTEYAVAITNDEHLAVQAHGGKDTTRQALPAPIGKEAASGRIGRFVAPSRVSVLGNEKLWLVDLDAADLLMQPFPGLQVASPVAEKSSLVAMAGVTAEGGLVATVWDTDLKTTSDDYAIDAKLLTSDKQPLKIRSITVGAKTGAKTSKSDFKYRLLVEVSDDSLWLLEDGLVKWHREEALANVEDIYFADLPASTAEVASTWTSSRPSLMERMNAEVLTLKKALGYSKPEDDATLKDITIRMSTSLFPYRDANGFRKFIIVLTSSGKLFGLHSGQGRVVWQANLGRQGVLKKIFQWQLPLDPDIAPKILLVGSSSGETHAVAVDAYNGAVLEKHVFRGNLKKVLHLPHSSQVDKAEQQAYALVFDDLSVKVLPESTSKLADDLPIHFWIQSGDRLTGLRLDSWKGGVSTYWDLAFPAPQSSLLKLIVPDPTEPIYSYSKVLGSREMKLKYLNQNVVFAISGTQASDGQDSDSLLTVQLVDTITGQVLYGQSLQGARGPVAGVWSENWVVYSYYSISNRRIEVAVLEFYEAQPQAYSIPSLLFGRQNSSYSSVSPVPLEVLHQSYWAPQDIKTMAITSTRKGITSKQILVGTDNGQVYLLDKRFVDPRRPRGPPTKDEQADILPPYNEELMFIPTGFASHKQIIEGLAGIATAPANLESTSLALAYGLDMFFTRIQPSKTFDLLPDDFPYAMLVLVFVALSAGSLILKRVDEQKAVKKKWT